MTTFLDLLILVVLALAAVSLIATVLMFLVKNKTVKRVCLYLAAALGIYVGGVGLYILWPMYLGQSVIALLTILTAVGAVVMERLSKERRAMFLTAEIMAAAALFVGMINAFAL